MLKIFCITPVKIQRHKIYYAELSLHLIKFPAIKQRRDVAHTFSISALDNSNQQKLRLFAFGGRQPFRRDEERQKNLADARIRVGAGGRQA